MMGPARLRSRAGLATAIAIVVALAAGLFAAVAAVASATVVEGARAAIGEARGAGPVVRVAIRWAGQQPADAAAAAVAAAEQDDAVREALAATMPEAALEAASSIRSEPLAIDGLSAQLVLRSDAALADRSQLTEGAWSARVDEAALHAGAAAALDLQVGDVITLPGRGDAPVTVRVTGLWEPLDGRDPAWAGDPIADRGADGITAGPLVVDESLWRDLATRPIAEWVAVLEPSRVSAAVLDEVTATLPLFAGVIDDDERSQGTGIVMNGGLAATVSEVQRAAAGVSAVVPVAVALIAIAGLTTLLELQRLLVAVRRDETVLLRSRGASPRRITTHAALETAVIAVPAAALGAAGGVFAVLAASPERQTALASDPAPIVALAALSGGAVALAAVLLATILAWRGARRALRRDTLNDSGRLARAVGAVALVLVGVAAGVAVSQYWLYGGPVVPTADGGAAVDPVAVLAPVLVLVAGALLAVVLVEPIARLLARTADRSVRLAPVLVARSLARSAAIVTAPVLLLGLGVAGVTMAAAVDATTRDSERAARELTLGAPLVVTGGLLDVQTRSELGALGEPITLDGIDFSGGPVAIAELTLSGARGTLLVVPSEVMRSTVAPAGGAVTPAALADAIAPEGLPMPEIPETATRIRLDADGGILSAVYWVADERGGVARIASDGEAGALLPEAGSGAGTGDIKRG
ncbi:FtsX-like permease family protein [Sediminivirga luteola]|uniref:FtsX-like permease family protein n=1 Tax=Sediminivirga luteola TaxID=1774748 RepID=UPI001F594138|nr:FtsX-like permease family protein [Sediminivirga luteola]MCI2266831.1 hypothetical protein [Sediminivirga luteola]